jgi:dihydrofolate reductase
LIVSIIVAFDLAGTIGFNNNLPWHLPADLKHFKSVTMGHSIIMGRKTFESIGKPLPGRNTIVITHNKKYHHEGITVVHSLEQALQQQHATNEVFIIGGAEIFNLGLQLSDKLYTTLIHHRFDGDTLFPEIGMSEWEEQSIEEHSSDEKNKWSYSFINYSRKKSSGNF